MAQVSTFRNDDLPIIATGVVHVQKAISVVNGSANSGDTIDLMALPVGENRRLVSAVVRTSGTLGASSTVQLRVGGTAVTTATTAGAASKVDSASDADVPLDVNGGTLIDLLVGGANITASATITVDLFFAARKRVPA
jgi:hypothetical protein